MLQKMVHNTNSKLTQQNGHSLDWTDIQKIISSSSLLLWPSSFRWLTSISATFFDVNARALIFSRDVPHYTWLWIFFPIFFSTREYVEWRKMVDLFLWLWVIGLMMWLLSTRLKSYQFIASADILTWLWAILIQVGTLKAMTWLINWQHDS